ncbi:hypothetical protein CHUAL_010376 [Chamberlinius hualienensis]
MYWQVNTITQQLKKRTLNPVLKEIINNNDDCIYCIFRLKQPGRQKSGHTHERKRILALIMSVKTVLIVLYLFATIFIDFCVKGSTHNVNKHNGIVICYVHTYAIYREGRGKFNVADFDSTLCTHVIHHQIGLNQSTHKIKVTDPSLNLDKDEDGLGGFRNVTNLKSQNSQLKTMVSIGGWEEGSKTFTPMVSSIENRQKFVSSVIEFLNKYNFDGVEIDWRFPTLREGGAVEDKDNFVHLLKDLKTAFEPKGWILVVTLTGNLYFDAERVYNIPEISKNADYLIVMNYDFHGYWNKRLGHVSPLYEGKNGFDKATNANYTMQYYVKHGIDKSKTLFGLTFYGRAYTMDNRKFHFVGDPAQNAPQLGNFSKEIGLINYNEMCVEVRSTWTKKWDNYQHVPYAYKDDYWVSYEDAGSITEKVQYTIDNQFGGVSVYTIDMDDITGYCHDIPMHLLSTVNKVFEENYVKSVNTLPGYYKIPNQKSNNAVQPEPIENIGTLVTSSLYLLSLSTIISLLIICQ